MKQAYPEMWSHFIKLGTDKGLDLEERLSELKTVAADMTKLDVESVGCI